MSDHTDGVSCAARGRRNTTHKGFVIAGADVAHGASLIIQAIGIDRAAFGFDYGRSYALPCMEVACGIIPFNAFRIFEAPCLTCLSV